jgi:sulfide:quinone oxidoreductase
MARIVILGAGFAGHTAALYLGDALAEDHEITVVNRREDFSYVPSWVWVGVGHMPLSHTLFPLAPVYRRSGVKFVHGRATEVHPDERYVVVEPPAGASGPGNGGGLPRRLDYDHLVVATGPHLDFAGTPGLGPEGGFSQSICTGTHAEGARDRYLEEVERLARGERRRFVIGTGHPGATCQGAAFEYLTNIHKDLVRRGVRDRADLLWLSNEQTLGDFGVNGVTVRRRGRRLTSEKFIGAIFREYGIRWQVQTGVLGLDEGIIDWEDFSGRRGETGHDFSMLIPRFLGQPLAWVDRDGNDVSAALVAPNGLVKVDAEYGLPYEQLLRRPEAWPSVYQNQAYPEIFAAGIAFAPPGPISVPHTTANGTSISAAPPRTGMVSGVIGRVVALNIIDLVKTGRMTHGERMSEMYAACIASMGDSLWDGSAAVIMIYPVVPDFRRYPNEEGRDLFVTHMEMGLAGAWMKRMIHTTFRHKLRRRIGWRFIPE